MTFKSSDSPSLPQKNAEQLLATWDYTIVGVFLNFGKNILHNIDMLIAHAFCLRCQLKPFSHKKKNPQVMLCSDLYICFLSWHLTYSCAKQLNTQWSHFELGQTVAWLYFLTCSFLESKLTSVLISPMGYKVYTTEKHEVVPFWSSTLAIKCLVL